MAGIKPRLVLTGGVRWGQATSGCYAAAEALTRWSTSGDAGQRVLSRKAPRVFGLVAAALALHGMTIPPRNNGGWVMFI